MHAGARRRKGARWGLALTAVTALGASALVPPVNAAVSGPRVIVVSPESSVVAVSGLDDETYTITLERGGLPVSSATGTPDASGTLEINAGAQPFCWIGVTPEVIPGDEVHLTGGGVDDDFATVEDIKVTSRPVGNEGNDAFTVTGTLGADLDLDNVNVLVRFPFAADEWRADANTSDEDNTLELDGSTWTATFTTSRDGIPVDAEVIAAARTPTVLEATYGVGGDPEGDPPYNEATADRVGAGAPIPEGCPRRARRTIQDVSPVSINLNNPGSDLTVSGVTGGVSPTVRVDLSDGTPPTISRQASLVGTPPDAVPTEVTWRATFSAAELTTLDGAITVTAEHAPIPGGAQNTRTVLKDFVAPGVPTVSPDGGTFRDRVSVTMAGEDGGRILFNLRGGDPSQNGTVFTGPFLITGDTLLHAVQQDAAGNLGPQITRRFTKLVPPGPGSGTPPGAGAGAGPRGGRAIVPLAPSIAKAKSGKPRGVKTATARWRPPKANGAVRNGYDVRALKLRPGRAAKVLRPKSVGPKATKVKVTLPKGKYRFQVRASSAAGNSPWSGRSNKVTAR